VRARGHLTGGAVTAWGVASLAAAVGTIPGVTHPLWWAVAATALFFSLFPDVDTDSVPRRWFYRGVLGVLLYLAWSGWWIEATLVAGLSLLPLVDHHRGWTHGRFAPLLLPAGLCAGLLWWEGWPGRDDLAVGDVLTPRRLTFVAAGVVGWYAHLLLDGLFRLFPHDPD
jgi:hypothetical protein